MSRLFYGAERAMSLSYEWVRRMHLRRGPPPPAATSVDSRAPLSALAFTHFYMFTLEPLHFYGTLTFSRGLLLNNV